MDFQQAFEQVIGHEGGYVNDPRDPGGETKFGISKRSYPHEWIESLTLDRARAIYQRDFWNPLALDRLPPALRYYLFDTAVNCGVGFAAESLQRAAGVLPDGQVGPKTIGAVNADSAPRLLRLMFVDRCMRYALNANDQRFGRGWFARLFDVTYRTIALADPRVEAAG
jgi:lysozyme family protein